MGGERFPKFHVRSHFFTHNPRTVNNSGLSGILSPLAGDISNVTSGNCLRHQYFNGWYGVYAVILSGIIERYWKCSERAAWRKELSSLLCYVGDSTSCAHRFMWVPSWMLTVPRYVLRRLSIPLCALLLALLNSKLCHFFVMHPTCFVPY